MSRIDTLVCTDARKTKYRFVVLTMIFLVYAINYADRTNIGAVLPFIIDEFHINNFEAGAIASMFFLGYAVSQIRPAFSSPNAVPGGWYRSPFSASPPLPG